MDLLRRASKGGPQRIAKGTVTLLSWDRPAGAVRTDSALALVSFGDVVGTLARVTMSDVSSLRGDFALLACHGDELLLARGFFGGRSLYYTAYRPGCPLMACSRLAPLVGALGRCPLERRRLAMLLTEMYDPDGIDLSPFEGIRRVPPGAVLSIRSDGHITTGSLRLPTAQSLREMHPEEIACELRSGLMRAVARRVDSHDRVAVLASGGVDSSAVLAAVVAHARASGRIRVQALTMDVAGPGDDRPYFALLCKELGVTPIRFTPSDCAKYVHPAMTLGANPSVWPNAASDWLLLDEAGKRGIPVALSGYGGDDLFDGDPRVYAARARRGDWLGALSKAIRLRGSWRATAWGRVRDFVVRPLAAAAVPDAVRRMRHRLVTRRTHPWVTRYVRDVVSLPDTARWLPACNGAEFAASIAVAGYLAESADGTATAEEAAGCLRVDPLFAPEIVEIVAAIPQEWLLHGDRVRGLLRLALRGLVPEQIRLRTDKASFEPALGEVITAAGGLGALRYLATPRELAKLGLVEPAAFTRHFERALTRGLSDSYEWAALWPVLALERFARAHASGEWDVVDEGFPRPG